MEELAAKAVEALVCVGVNPVDATWQVQQTNGSEVALYQLVDKAFAQSGDWQTSQSKKTKTKTGLKNVSPKSSKTESKVRPISSASSEPVQAVRTKTATTCPKKIENNKVTGEPTTVRTSPTMSFADAVKSIMKKRSESAKLDSLRPAELVPVAPQLKPSTFEKDIVEPPNVHVETTVSSSEQHPSQQEVEEPIGQTVVSTRHGEELTDINTTNCLSGITSPNMSFADAVKSIMKKRSESANLDSTRAAELVPVAPQLNPSTFEKDIVEPPNVHVETTVSSSEQHPSRQEEELTGINTTNCLSGLAADVSSPNARMSADVSSPDSGMAADVSSPHARMAADVFSPHAQMAADVFSPHAQMAADVSSPHAQMTNDVSSPHDRMAADFTSPHARIAADFSSPHARIAADFSSPHARMAVDFSSPHARMTADVFPPHARMEADVFTPHARMTADVCSPHARMTNDVSSPHARMTADVCSPHARMTNDVSSPHVRMTNDVFSPHARMAADFTSPHARMSSDFTSPHARMAADFSSPHARMAADFSSPHARIGADFPSPHARMAADFPSPHARMAADVSSPLMMGMTVYGGPFGGYQQLPVYGGYTEEFLGEIRKKAVGRSPEIRALVADEEATFLHMLYAQQAPIYGRDVIVDNWSSSSTAAC